MCRPGPSWQRASVFRSGKVPGSVLALGKKGGGEKAKERKKSVCCPRSHSTNKYFPFKRFERKLIAKNRNPMEEGTIKEMGTA